MKRIISFCNGSYLADTLRRHWWLGFINFVVLFFAMPLGALLRTDGDGHTQEAMARICRETFGSTGHGGYMTMQLFLGMALGFLAGMVLLHYMHDRRQVNFYHAQPIRRERLLLTRMGTALVLFVIPLAANALLTAVIMGANARAMGMETLPMEGFGARLGLITLAFLLVFAFTALAGVLSGTAFAHLEMTALIMGLPLAAYVLFHLLMDLCYATYLSPLSEMLSAEGMAVTGLCPPLYMLLASGADALHLPAVGALAALAAGMLGLSIGLYRLRASERAHMPLVFPATMPIVRLAACAAVALGMGMFFYAITDGTVMGFMGGILGGLLCHMFCQVQFRKDFRAMFAGLPSLAGLLAVLAAVTVCMGTDVTGYDRYIPQRDRVASVSLVTDMEGFGPLYTGANYQTAQFDHAESASPQVIEGTLALLEEIGRTGTRTQDDTLFLGHEEGGFMELRLRFTLENGQRVYRMLSLDGVPDSILDRVEAICNTPAYLEKHHIFAIPQDVTPEYIKFEPIFRRETRSDMPGATAEVLMRALREDIAKYGVHRDDPVRGVLWVTVCMDDAMHAAAREASGMRGAYYDIYLEVRESYEGTLTVLRDAGWLEESLYPADFTEDIDSLRIYRTEGDVFTGVSVLITGAEDIDAIVQAALPEDHLPYRNQGMLERSCAFVLQIEVAADGSYTVTADNGIYPDDAAKDMIPGTVVPEAAAADRTDYREDKTAYRCTFRFPAGKVPAEIAEALEG